MPVVAPASVFRRTVGSSAALALLAVAFILVRNELDRLIGEVLSLDGHTTSLGEVTGVSAWGSRDAWAGWKSAHDASAAQAFIATSAAVDLLFVACYGLLVLRLITRATGSWNASSEHPIPVSLGKASVLLTVLVGFNVVRDVLVLATDFTAAGSGSLGVAAFFVMLASYGTILALVVLGLQLLLSQVIGGMTRCWLNTTIRAIYAQRLSAIVVAAVGALSLLPIANLFEQISDVYRGWVTFPAGRSFFPQFTAPVILTLVLDFVAFALTGLSLFALGRQRAVHYEKLEQPDTRPDGRSRGWLYLALGAAVIAVVVGLATHGASIDILVIIAFLVAVLLVPGSSFIIRCILKGREAGAPFLHLDLDIRPRDVRRIGDVLVAIWIGIWVLGPFKALLSPMFLAVTGQFSATRYVNSFLALLGFELLLLVLGVGAPVAFRFLVARYTKALRMRELGSTKVNNRLAIAAVSVSGVGIVALLLLPATFAYAFGPVGSLVLLLGCWTTIIGMVIVTFGKRKPLALFQVLRMRSTPIVTLLVVVPLVISFVDVTPTLHAIRATAGGTLSSRHSVKRGLALWDTQQEKCTTRLSDGAYVRPLLLVAAQGGGIRAATWTVDVLDKLPAVTGRKRASECAAGATFLSSGASGGSIGIATFRHAGNAGASPQDVQTTNFAGPNALAADVAGLLDGDIVGGVTGIRVPSPTDLTNPAALPWAWHDRTALQELTWEAEAPQFAKPYSVAPNDPTGYDIFNSEDAVTSCKVIVSQLNLGATTNPPNGISNCTGPGTELSNTIDLENYIGRDCMADLNWSTAAELSARFPVVSPPGRISAQTLPKGCLTKSRAKLDSMQLVDGGTADNSAIGTLSDLAPELAADISADNAKATGSSSSPFIVPVVIYASNDPGLDLTSAPNKTRPDSLVPIAAIMDAQGALVTPSAWLTRIANGLSDVCVGATGLCGKAVKAIRASIPQGIVVASPSTDPAVSVPLGWSLSGFSRARLAAEATYQAECGSRHAPAGKLCLANRGYGKLGSVLDLFRYATQSAPAS